jgi:hypothetical protein
MPPIIHLPVSSTASQSQTRIEAHRKAPEGVTVTSPGGRFAVTASKATSVQEPPGNRQPDMAHLALSLGLELGGGAPKKQSRVYTLQASTEEAPGQTQPPNSPARQ